MIAEDLVSRKAVLDLAKDICVPTPDGEYRYRSIDPMEVYELPSAELSYYKNNYAYAFLLHKETGVPISECIIAHQKAIDYLWSKMFIKG